MAWVLVIMLTVASILSFWAGFTTLIWVFSTPGSQPVEAALGGWSLGMGIGTAYLAGLTVYEELSNG